MKPAANSPSGTDNAPPIPLGQKAAFGAGGAAEEVMNNSVNMLLSPVYNISLGVRPEWLGYAQAAPGFWGAIFGPLVGSFSDNARTRWGRRRPFMLLGAVLSALSFVAMWWVPRSWGEFAMFVYIVALSLIFYSAATLFQVPWNALGLSLTPNIQERTRVWALRQFFSMSIGFCLPWLFWLTERDVFHGVAEGARWVSLGVGLVILIGCAIPILFCKENYTHAIQTQPKVPLIKGFLESFQNRPFVFLTVMIVCILTGLFLVDTLGLYVMIYHVYGGDEKGASTMQGITGSCYRASALSFLPVIGYLSARFGKKQILASALFLAFLGTASKWWCYSPAHPWTCVIPAILMGPGLTSMFVLTSSLLADICDYDEFLTGCRREATYTAVSGWCIKLGVTGALVLSGYILTSTGFDKHLGGAQSPHTLLWMRGLFSFVPPMALLIAVILTLRFPLTEARSREIQSILKQRKVESAPETTPAS
jgi:GPH family glycoside/pentoside/hexuronide:cation symporter